MQFKTTTIPLAAALAFAMTGSALAQEAVIRLGHVAPMSGGQAHFGRDNANGAIMAIEELNSKGITLGGQKVKFQALLEDDGADPKQGTNAAQKLVDAKVNGVIGHLNSGTTIPASKIYHDAGIPQVSPAATNPKYTQQGFKTAFRVVANDAQLGQALGKYAVNELKAKTLAIIDDRTAYGQGVADEFLKGVRAANPAIKTVRQYTHDKATDFNAILTSIKASRPDIVFFGGMDNVGAPMLRQMQQLGINAKFMGGDGICTTEIIKLAGNALGNDRMVCAEAGGVTGEREKTFADFHQRYKKRFNMNVQLYAPYVYDAVHTMVAAMVKADSADPKRYLPELAKIKHEGVTGAIAFDDKGDIRNGALTLYTYRDGQKTRLVVVQ